MQPAHRRVRLERYARSLRFPRSRHPAAAALNLRDWLPADHHVHFILDAVDSLEVRQVRVNTRGTGSEQYPPAMLLCLLLYSYATGTFSSRRIKQSTHPSVPVRLITADTHPDHDTLCTFRWENQALLTESFVQVLQLAQQLKVLKFGQLTVAADGTKVLASASKHSAVSYGRAGELIEQLELEVKQLLAKAEQADSTPLQDGLTIPEEITRRQERKAALAQARVEIESHAPTPATASNSPSMKRSWRPGPAKKSAAKKSAASRRRPRRLNRRPKTNLTSPTPRAGS
jgi:transposase